jgi:ribosome-binding ATPase
MLGCLFATPEFLYIVRLSMIRLGILGLPNVGKSTLFNLLTSQKVPAENYPFCTIEPNIAVAKLPDPRTSIIGRLTGNPELIQASIELVDVAGLIEDASAGAGLGNQFLGHIRDVNGLIHVLAAFDPIGNKERSAEALLQDARIIQNELLMADVEVVDRHRIHAKGSARSSQEPKTIFLFETLDKLWRAMKFEKQSAVKLGLSNAEWDLIHTYDFLTAKKLMVLVNAQEADTRDLSFWEKTLGTKDIALLSVKQELELGQLTDESERTMFRDSFTLIGSLEEFYTALKRTFSLRIFFTFGKGITRAWLIREGATAQDAAGLIHEDFKNRLVRMRVYRPEDLEKYGLEEIEKRELFRIEGKDYQVADGDILWFLTT